MRKGGEQYKTPRNAVSGILNRDDIDTSVGPILTLVNFEMSTIFVPFFKIADFDWEGLIRVVQESDYPADGLVIKLADSEYARALGVTSHHARSEISLKFANPTGRSAVHTTGYTKWTANARDQIVPNLAYVSAAPARDSFWVPKFQHPGEPQLLAKVLNQPLTIEHVWGTGGEQVYYRTTGGLYWKVFTTSRPRFYVNGVAGSSSRETRLPLRAGFDPRTIVAILSSTTFWWWYTIASNLRDLNPADIQAFRLNERMLQDEQLALAGQAYLNDLDENSIMLTREQRQTGTTQTQSFKIQRSKALIDEIDRLLAPHFGFDEEELDFIINYDIKYRMGAEEDDAE